MPIYPPSSTPISPETPVTSSIVSPIAVPTYGSFGNFSVLVKALIKAPTTETKTNTKINPVDLVRDTASWKEWNTFCPTCTFVPPSADAILNLGSFLHLDVFMAGDGLVPGARRSQTSGEEVTRIEDFTAEGGRSGHRISWRAMDYPSWLMRAERVLEFVELEGGDGWEYTSWETFGGPLAMVVKLAVGATLVDRLGDYGRDIKTILEKQKGDETAGN